MGIFQTILQNGISRGHAPGKTQSAREWYRNSAKDFGGKFRENGKGKEAGRIDYGRNLNKKLMRENRSQLKEVVKPGSMYMYFYDPKYKETLPFYDRFPLIFPFRVQSDRFWGINMHYLPLPLRAKLMDSLYDLANNNRYDESTKLSLSYKLLNGSSKTRFFEPCVKQYLFSHVESKFLYVEPEFWDTALWLPLESFAKKSKTQVWANSKSSLGITK